MAATAEPAAVQAVQLYALTLGEANVKEVATHDRWGSIRASCIRMGCQAARISKLAGYQARVQKKKKEKRIRRGDGEELRLTVLWQLAEAAHARKQGVALGTLPHETCVIRHRDVVCMNGK